MLNLWHTCLKRHMKLCHIVRTALPVCHLGFRHASTRDDQLSYAHRPVPKSGLRMRAGQLIIRCTCASEPRCLAFPERDPFACAAVPKTGLACTLASRLESSAFPKCGSEEHTCDVSMRPLRFTITDVEYSFF